MKRFTDAVRQSLVSRNWYGALAMTLTLPDICGRIDSPTLKSRERYAQWFDEYLKPRYGTKPHGGVWLSGTDCYALRCAYLHTGGDETTEQWARERYEKYFFTTDNAHLIDAYGQSLTLNVRRFCADVCDAVDTWTVDRSSVATVQTQLDGLLRIHAGELSPAPGVTMFVAPDPECAPREE